MQAADKKPELLLITKSQEASQMPLRPFLQISPHHQSKVAAEMCMSASRAVIIESCLSAVCLTRSPLVSLTRAMLSCGFVAKLEHVTFTVNQRSIDRCGIFFFFLTKVIQLLLGL